MLKVQDIIDIAPLLGGGGGGLVGDAKKHRTPLISETDILDIILWSVSCKGYNRAVYGA